MIHSASIRVCMIDWLPVSESKVFKAMLQQDVRTAVKMTTRITVSFDAIRKRGSDELNRVIDTIGYVPLNQRSEAS
jgi:hypothetical protein